MNILVCVKQVPDTTEIKIDPVTHTLMREGVPSILNPFDAYALELALRLRDAEGGSVTVLTMGLPKAAEVLREALAVGADTAYLLSDRPFGGADTLATSFALTSAIRYLEGRSGVPFDVVFCGKQAIDGDTAQVGPEIAEHLSCGQVTYATDAYVEDERLLVRRDADDGYQIMAATLPCVVSVTKTPFDLRPPSIRKKLAAARVDIETITAEKLQIDIEMCGLKGSPTKVKRSFTPTSKQGGVVLRDESVVEMARKLNGLLTDAGVI